MLLGLTVAGCSNDDAATLAEGEGGGAGELTDSYVTLNFTMAFAGQGTRADNPTGGEAGDGTEAGLEDENKITSAVAFLYQSADGINRTDNPTVTPVVFNSVTLQDDGTYTTSPERVTLPVGDYHIIVVANPGTEDWWTTTTDLNALRTNVQKTAWATDGNGGYSDFLMSSESDASLTLASNPETNPAKVNVDVERMAARIDYQAEGSFDCGDQSGKVEILGAAIVNDYTAGSYLIKRVADDVTGSNIDYLGDEVEGKNYVLDPKTNSTKLEDDYKSGTYYPVIIDTEGKWADPNVWDAFVKEGTPLTVGGETWNRIGYTMENTTPTTATKEATNTGVVFKAQFTPTPGTVTGNYDYDNHETFFSYRSVLYASMEDVMKAFYGEEVFNSFDEKVGACTTWDDVQAFIDDANLNSLDPSGYYKYLNDKVAEKGTFPENANGLKWSEYMSAECGYSSTTADNKTTVKLDQNNKTTRVALRPYGVSTYEDATCYYTWWVKHSNDGDDTKTGPMEYAIVRNNIYKLTVTSVAGLGGDVPGGTPESGDDIVIRVNVKDWTLLKLEEIIM